MNIRFQGLKKFSLPQFFKLNQMDEKKWHVRKNHVMTYMAIARFSHKVSLNSLKYFIVQLERKNYFINIKSTMMKYLLLLSAINITPSTLNY